MKTTIATAPGLASVAKKPWEACATLVISGTYSGLTFSIQGSVDDTNFFNVGVLDKSSGSWLPGGTAISPANNATVAYLVPAENLGALAANIADLSSGSVTISLQSTASPVNLNAEAATEAQPALTQVQYTAISTNTPCTLTGPQMAGADDVVVNLTATLAGAGTLTSATAAQIVAAIPGAQVGQTYRLRIMNTSSGDFAWTLTTTTGITLTGTMSIAQNTWRDFLVTLTSLTAVTIESIGTGTLTGSL